MHEPFKVFFSTMTHDNEISFFIVNSIINIKLTVLNIICPKHLPKKNYMNLVLVVPG